MLHWRRMERSVPIAVEQLTNLRRADCSSRLVYRAVLCLFSAASRNGSDRTVNEDTSILIIVMPIFAIRQYYIVRNVDT